MHKQNDNRDHDNINNMVNKLPPSLLSPAARSLTDFRSMAAPGVMPTILPPPLLVANGIPGLMPTIDPPGACPSIRTTSGDG